MRLNVDEFFHPYIYFRGYHPKAYDAPIPSLFLFQGLQQLMIPLGLLDLYET